MALEDKFLLVTVVMDVASVSHQCLLSILFWILTAFLLVCSLSSVVLKGVHGMFSSFEFRIAIEKAADEDDVKTNIQFPRAL